MTSTEWIVLAVVVLLVIAAIAAFSLRRRRATQRLQQRFGPEYNRTLEESGNRASAEKELRDREKRHEQLELRPLDQGQRQHFEQRWAAIQADFLDDPERAAKNADRLVTEVMAARGYPTERFEQQAEDLSVSHPRLTQQYRDARQVSTANERGEVSTEKLRKAVTTYRSLVETLLYEDTNPGRNGDDAASPRSSAAGSSSA